MQLLELQNCMAQALMAPLTKSSLAAKQLACVIVGNKRLGASARISIYKRSYWYRILDSFREDFPGLQVLLGEDKFVRLAREYLAQTPSRSYTLRNLGQDLEVWLQDNSTYAGRHLGAALDMVRLEWADIEAFDDPSLPLPEERHFANMGEDFLISLQPHVRLLRLRHPVDNLRIAANEAGSPRSILKQQKLAKQIKQADPKEIGIAVYRLDNSVYYRRVDPYELRILELFRQQETVAKAIEKAFESCSFTPQKKAKLVGDWFAHWARLGWLYVGDKKSK